VPLTVARLSTARSRSRRDRLEPELRALAACPPRVPVVANVDADGATPRPEWTRSSASVAPVRWQDVERLAAEGVSTFVRSGRARCSPA
jgi:malonyl CoA-acyl carrier protein transacylase